MGTKDSTPSVEPGFMKRSKSFYTRILVTAFLCVTFYILGAWQNNPSRLHIDSTTLSVSDCSTTLDFESHHTASDASLTDLKPQQIPACDLKFSEYTPCQDQERSHKFDRARLVYRERHCPAREEKLRCLIPAPVGYRNPFPWPRSRDFAWFANVPHKELTVEKAIQNWIQYEGDKFFFPGGGTMFPRGADAYIDDIDSLLRLTDGTIRTALDTGCGVASWGAYLLKRNIITMSFAPRDSHEAQVQFALERGVPAVIGIMASQRLPYPARAFDIAHCSRCLIPWSSYDGLYLMEIDRVLRPGGYWILSGPPVNWKTHWKSWLRTKEDLQLEMTAIEDMAKSLCWTKHAEKENLAIWRKPLNHLECKRSKIESSKSQFCNEGHDPDSAWYDPMETCITPLPEVSRGEEVAGGGLSAWPARLTSTPPRVSNEEEFVSDTHLWAKRVSYYKQSVVPLLAKGRYRNIMDMNAGYGGFGAALAMDKRAWVMNVVPHTQKAQLGIIYERGLIGIYHDWCEAFSTYPRTYDLLHADKLFSSYENKCEMTEILIEMDRVLRPEGAVVIRDNVELLTRARKIMDGMRWQSKMFDHESGPFNKEKVLVAVKTYWVGGESQNSTLASP